MSKCVFIQANLLCELLIPEREQFKSACHGRRFE